MRRTVIAIVAVVTAAATGCMKGEEPARADTASAAAPATAAAPAPALDDATIVAIFDGANTADIETGELASTRGSSAEVREFGAMLARDHKQVRQSGRDLAAKLAVTPTPPADDAFGRAHAEAMQKLRALEGEAFDRAFLQHEAAYHAAVIDAVKQTLLPAISNAEVKDLVVKVAPAFEAHRVAAQQLEQKLFGSTTPR